MNNDEFEELRQLWSRLDKNQRQGIPPVLEEAELQSKLTELYNIANIQFMHDNFNEAINTWHRAYLLASNAKDEKAQSRCLRYLGDCYASISRLKESLACLLELEKIYNPDKSEHVAGLIQQIDIAIMIPLSFNSIQKLIHRCKVLIEQYGLSSSSMLLIKETMLAYGRCEYSLELMKAQEAMSVYDPTAYPNFNSYVHYYWLINALIDNEKWQEAEKWLAKYEGNRTYYYENLKDVSILALRCVIALHNEEWDHAWQLAQRRLNIERSTQKHPVGLYDYVNTGIQCGHLQDVKPELIEMLIWYRNSENGFYRYRIRRVAGDYYKAVARNYRGTECIKYKRIAQQFYNNAMKLAAYLDDRLCNNMRKEEILNRIKSLN